ncbi:hypothetical protein L6164_028884 [Bauhinia variegata]|uniref:Uncharacterized protein n=1 Tax=Bauhinia variegata TaxID=167791 RepID=A0ACB9L7X2_BAUVA|nr:hypothetical protein L6164_028884 [Bauhinia variegata]
MVSGLELLLIGIGTNAFSIIMNQILKKGTSQLKESVNSILKEMKPLIEGVKTPDCSSSTRPGSGVPEYLKQLIQKVDEGNKIVQKGENKEELDQWIELLRHLLSRALLKTFTIIAEKEKDITPLLDSNQGNRSISLPLHFKEDEHRERFREFLRCAIGVSEPLLQVDSVSTDKTKDAEQIKQSVPQASKVVAESGQFPESVDNPTEEKLVLKKVVIGVLARDGYAKRMVEQLARKCKVKGM